VQNKLKNSTIFEGTMENHMRGRGKGMRISFWKYVTFRDMRNAYYR